MTGSTQIVKGRIEEAAGALTDNDKLRAKGQRDQAVGHAKQAGEEGVRQARKVARRIVDNARSVAQEVVNEARCTR